MGGVAASRAPASIQSVTALVPKSALVEHNGGTEEMLADRVPVGPPF